MIKCPWQRISIWLYKSDPFSGCTGQRFALSPSETASVLLTDIVETFCRGTSCKLRALLVSYVVSIPYNCQVLCSEVCGRGSTQESFPYESLYLGKY